MSTYLKIVDFREREGGPWLPPINGVVYTMAPLIEVHALWDGVDPADIQVTQPAGAGPTISVTPLNDHLFSFPLALPDALDTIQEVSITVTDGVDPTSFQVNLLSQLLKIKDPHISNLAVTDDEWIFHLHCRPNMPNTIDGTRSELQVIAGSAKGILPNYQANVVLPNPVAGELQSVEVRMPRPAYENLIFLGAVLTDDWGQQTTFALQMPAKRFQALDSIPLRIDYDHTTQEASNCWPLWTTSRMRDYRTLAADPRLSFMGSANRFHQDQQPYDYTEPPVTQRLINALIGPMARSARRTINALARAGNITTASVDIPGAVYRLELPDEDPSKNTQEVYLGAQPETILSSLWEREGDWDPIFPSELTIAGAGRALCNTLVSHGTLTVSVRAETDRQQPSEVFTQAERLDIMSGVGTFGLLWRWQDELNYWRAGWGWKDARFGLFVEQVDRGAVIKRFFDQRFYRNQTQIRLEIKDDGHVAELLVNNVSAWKQEIGTTENPWRLGLWSTASSATVQWQPYWSDTLLRGAAPRTLLATLGLQDQNIQIKQAGDMYEFLNAAPTRCTLTKPEQPQSILIDGAEEDAERLFVDASKNYRRIQWSVSGNQIIKGLVEDPLFSYWIRYDGRLLLDWELLSCRMHSSEWLLVLLRRGTTYKLAVVDSATPDPLIPQASLHCEELIDLPVLGASDVVRNIPNTEHFLA